MQTTTTPTIARAALACGAALFTHTHALADAPGAGHTEGSTWGLGVAVMSETRPYRDFNQKTEVLPLISYENQWIRVFGPGVELKLGAAGDLSYALTASFARDGYKPGDSSYLSGMAKRKDSLWLGGRASWSGDLGSLSASWQGDASGNSKGQKLKLGVERRYGFGNFGLTPHLTAQWHDSKFVQYYFGVEAGEAVAGRAAYRAGSAVNTELGLRVDYRLAPQQMLFGDISATALGSSIKKSPLVDRSSVPELRLGYLYQF